MSQFRDKAVGLEVLRQGQAEEPFGVYEERQKDHSQQYDYILPNLNTEGGPSL